MSNLSEEEIIEIIEELMCLYKEQMNCDKYYNEIVEKSTRNFKGLQGLLDLYQQEKEKNKELKVLIEQNLKYSHNLEKDLFENCSNYVISKDKIREIIYPTPDNPISYEVQTSAMYKKLEQLLEEE